MMDPGLCCLDEDEFEDKIRVSKDARMRMMKEPKKDEPSKDPIADAEKEGRRKYLEMDEIFLRAARMDVKTIFYLEDRAKSCYPLRQDVESYNSLMGCFQDDHREPTECECEIRNYLKEIQKEKHDFVEIVSKRPKEKNTGKKGEEGKSKKAKPAAKK